MTKEELIKEAIMAAQSELGLTPDGVFGPVTTSKVTGFDVKFIAIASPIENVLAQPTPGFFGASWIGSYMPYLGLYETSPILNAVLVPEWRLEHCPDYTTLIGNAHPWCAVLVGASLRKAGITGTNNPGAVSYATWAVTCPYWFGAVISMLHASGGHHVGFFLYWIDEAKKIAAIYSGNSGNQLCIAAYCLDGSGRKGTHKVLGGPRGPKGWVGQSPTMAEVLKLYPHLKVGGTSESTT